MTEGPHVPKRRTKILQASSPRSWPDHGHRPWGLAAGFAVQQTIKRYDTAIAPLVGLGVLAGYAAVALGVATLLLRRRDA